jgi:TolB protein
MMKKLFLLMLVLALPEWGYAQARVKRYVDQKIALDVSGLMANSGAAQVFRRTLESDIARSGWLAVGGAGRGEYVLQGQVNADGSQVNASLQVFDSNRKSYLSKTYSGDSAAIRNLAHKAADDILFALTGHKGLFGARLALIGTRTGSKELYLCDSDGQNLRQLTNDKTVSLAPQWGPDGQTLVYTSFRSKFPDVYKVNLSSGSRTRIASYPGLNTGGAVAPDGNHVALILSKDGNPELYIKNLNSGALTRLTQTPKGAEASPSWSPDGNRIAYVSDQSGTPQIYVISRSGGTPKRLTSRGSQNVAPDWGANGLIAFASLLGGRFQVCLIDPNTFETKAISPLDADYEDPSWAPDGRHLACTVSRKYRSSVYLLDTMGDPPVALVESSGDWSAPSWSPR